jgi:hypothetical protein
MELQIFTIKEGCSTNDNAFPGKTIIKFIKAFASDCTGGYDK